MPLQAPSIGEKFPEIEVMTTHGKIKLPDHFRGKWFVLFSHPADFTPVCTTEFVAFAKRYEDFKKLNTELIGLSVDSTFSHIKWAEWIKEKLGVEIPFPIIADPTGEVAKKLGLLHAQSSTATVRAVFVVDDKGVVRAILYYPQEVGRNIDEILRLIESLQISDKYGRAIPANWPNNELIGDNLIVPPAATVQEAEERLKKFKCFDWWFCYEDKATAEEKELARKFLKRVANC
ncbi:peroxiredoxin [Hyperthermus butylicus]|uniref:Peroxiredoxin n=1 Tax=Hyperthermus butylicus (strain DSM 5456 / JCM 9403 / PLM1-5) TaxID=415426 RepID=TDXH_HYPBU|nr:peroxiredoxin [Hyperthermus butylicus]A2BJD9.1 RecName: Full=Peroxiredoxin; AltName: Full=Thioredoxin peroxidase; AltName: Full=Thioredoxin-dependent peroxiredoxin [Hyperthermus butylicus DSM 5456]ABM80100.1 Peroxiredoxin family [Hyperthermus butylicus DSM 5456]